MNNDNEEKKIKNIAKNVSYANVLQNEQKPQMKIITSPQVGHLK